MYPTGTSERQSIKERTLAAQGRAKPSSEAVRVLVNGEAVVVDPSTLTGRERQLMKRALATSIEGEPDALDGLYAGLWVTMRRTDETLTFDEVLDAVTIGDLNAAEKVASGDDDSPEA